MLNSGLWKPNQKSSSTKREMYTCHVCMDSMRLIWLDYEKMRNMSPKRIPEKSLSEIVDQHTLVGNLCRYVRDLNLTSMNLLARQQKTHTAGNSTERIRPPRISQPRQKTSPIAGAFAERITIPGAWQQQSHSEAKYHQLHQLQLKLRQWRVLLQ